MTYQPADIDRKRLFGLFRDMVDMYSPSGKEETLAAFLYDYLKRNNLFVRTQPVDDDRYNLLVSTDRCVPETLFLGHIDTVPAFDIENYAFSVKNGQCHGLGTADMKSGCAAMIEAFSTAHRAGCLPDNVLLALVVGEEEIGDGTQALLENLRFDRAIVAEPTNLKPCLNHFGYIEMTVRSFGYRRHAAVSGRDTNAIRAMLRFLLRLEEKIEKNEPDTVLNIRDLHSSESGFAVPDRCSVDIDLHVPPGIRTHERSEDIRYFVEQELTQSGASGHEIEFPTLADGYRIDPNGKLPRQLKKIFLEQGIPWIPLSFKSHSDANLLSDAGCPPVILGPGHLAKAHTRDESVDFEQVVSAARLYTRLLANGC